MLSLTFLRSEAAFLEELRQLWTPVLGKDSKLLESSQVVSQRSLYQDILLRVQSRQGELLVQMNLAISCLILV